MVRRAIPTQTEILSLVRPMIPQDSAIKLSDVQERLRRALATTRTRAAEWLTAALLAEESGLTLISTTASGAVCRHFLDQEGREARTLVEGDNWRVTINQAGQHHGFAERGRLAAAADSWVITTDLLVSYAHAESACASDREQEAQRQALAQRRQQAASAAYLNEHHGDALALVRGLFARAGVLRNHLDHEARHHDQTVRATCLDQPDGTPCALAVITLRGDDINAVAAVLAELGIAPAAEPALIETPRGTS